MAKKIRIKKVMSVIERSVIRNFNYFNVNLYVNKYTKYLKKIGIQFTGNTGKVKYIDPSVYFDGTDYSLISIGDNVTISREVMILTHDFSITTAMASLNIFINRGEGEIYFKKPIEIGDNTFIGARVSILPGSKIGSNCIIGACSVVKGTIPDGSIVIGNPAKIISKTKDYALKHQQNNDFVVE